MTSENHTNGLMAQAYTRSILFRLLLQMWSMGQQQHIK